MKLAILTPWNKSFGYDPHEDTKELEKKLMVISHYPNTEEPIDLNDFLILYNSLLNIDDTKRPQVFIAFVKNVYVLNDRTFGDISYKVMNIIHNFTKKIKTKTVNNGTIWSQRFRQIRGRLPTKNEIIIRSLLD
jgi:CRISPR/Cas system CMR subunit Cmr4 (Cas7 group RAMP superfamily)